MLNVKLNFKNSHQDLSCSVCKNDEDSQEHMMVKCMKIQNKLTQKEFNSLFESDEDKMSHVIRKVDKIVEERNRILEN